MSKKDTGIVPIHGKEYKTVALRISEFREKHPDFTIHTELVEANEKLVIMNMMGIILFMSKELLSVF